MSFTYSRYNAREIEYDNSGSNLSATEVESALGELDTNKYPVPNVKLNTGSKAVNFGDNSNASGSDSIAIGSNTIASSFGSVALGRGANVQGGRGLSWQGNIYSGATDSIMLGYAGTISKTRSIGIGAFVQSNSFSEGAIGIGYNAMILGYQTIALGYQVEASGYQSTVIGSNSSSDGVSPYTVSYNTLLGANSSILGELANAEYNVALGVSTQINNCSHSIAIGNAATCSQNYSAQIGTGTNSEAFTLKFQNSTIAHADDGICANVGDGAPTSSPREGTLWVDRTNLRLYVRVNNGWKYTNLI